MYKKNIFVILIFIASSFLNLKSQAHHWESVVLSNDTWNYFVGNSDPGSNWYKPGFNDSTWLHGEAGFGYGDNDDVTIIPPVISVFLRVKFNVPDTSQITDILFHIDYDDGFIAYMNGHEIARSGLSGSPPAYNAFANSHEASMYKGGKPDQFRVNKNAIVNGENLLAVEVHNSNTNSSDMSAIPFLSFGMEDSSLTYRETPSWFEEPFVFTSSNLPILIIDTENGVTIPNEPKVNANLKIINNQGSINTITDEATDYNGIIGIEMRGSYSQSLPQKPYGFETRDSSGLNNNVPLLGLPAENDWVLLTHYNEKTFARNPVSFHLFSKMGHYAPRTRLCEVLVNGRYDGIYLLGEKIKIDNNRVDIAKLDQDDNYGDSLTGGYIIKIDNYSREESWEGNFSPIDYPGATINYVYHDPKWNELTQQQKNYIQDYIHSFETVLYSENFNHLANGYRKYIDVNSFIDYFIIGELSRNIDAYKKSCYYYKDKDKKTKPGLLHAGPVWDFDWAWLYLQDGCEHFGKTDGSGWAYKIDECYPVPTPNGWIVRLMEDKLFMDQTYTRYFELRKNILSNAYIHHFIDSVANLVKNAQKRHYNRWPILENDVGAREHPPIPSTYQGEINRLKEWIDLRLSWLDKNMPGEFIEQQSTIGILTRNAVKIYPNPAKNNVFIESGFIITSIKVYNLSGLLIKEYMPTENSGKAVNISELENGFYMIELTTADHKISTTKLIVKH